MKFIDLDDSWGEGILQDWYIHSVNPDDKPQWTDEHIEELCNDFYVIPKETTKYDIDCNLNRLKELSEAYKDGRCLVLPYKVGDTVYTNMRAVGWYYREKNKPYKAKIAFIGINDSDNFVNVVFENDNMLQFNFSDFGKTVFLTKEEAERALEEIEK